MDKKHKFMKSIKKAWYKIKLIDRCLIIVMAILMLESIYTLFVNEVNSQDTTTIDVVVRTTSAAIFGYFLSANFISGTSRKVINTDAYSNVFIDDNSSNKGNVPSQNNIMNVKNTIGFELESDSYKNNDKRVIVNNGEEIEERETSELQIVIATVICIIALIVLFIVRNFTTPATASLGTISQMRDFVSGCVGFLLGCPSKPN